MSEDQKVVSLVRSCDPATQGTLVDTVIASLMRSKEALSKSSLAVMVFVTPDGHIAISAHGRDMEAYEVAGILAAAQHVIFGQSRS